MSAKPYQRIPIVECGEPLVPIPIEHFGVESPHPYEKLGAPYGARSPFYLRQGVLDSLFEAQFHLQRSHPGWRIQIFDAYRPIAVQQFMVDYTFTQLCGEKGLSDAEIESQRDAILAQVYQFWASPSLDPATPPPHSTGGAIDVTLVDETGTPLDMGCPIDEISPRAYPQHFANARDSQSRQYHDRRQFLARIMAMAGFQRHPNEWWHFCLGDQMWVWLCERDKTARYGRVESVGE
jgi:D-alanyl-D-alanine dipeptidase